MEFYDSIGGTQKKVFLYLSDGGYYEDKPPLSWYPNTWVPYLRSTNHFHNPVAGSLADAGFSGILNIPFLLPGKSALVWSQLGESKQSPGGYYAWKDVRNYFYSALTEKDPIVRDTNFAQTFRGVGQLMHLVEDMSVPEHARDDGHYLDGYEEWVRDAPNTVLNTAFTYPIFFDLAALGQASAFSEASVPIANLFDTHRYLGQNPDLTVNQRSIMAGFTVDRIGLAEYTNANFLSPDTMFVKKFKYPDPVSSVTVQDYDIPSSLVVGSSVKRPYYIKTGDGEIGYRLAGVNYFKYYTGSGNNYPAPTSDDYMVIPPFDSNVYRDYAQRLLPRAVGYAASLMNYFFRGSLEVTPPDQYVYSVIDGSQTYPLTSTYWDANGVLQQVTTEHQQFTKIKAKIRNTTSNEEQAGEGTLMAVAEYSIIPDYEPDLSNYPPSAQNVYKNSLDYVPYSYSVSKPIPISSLSSSQATEFTFDFTDQPIPAGIVDFSLHFVFKGTLGGEKDTAVAVARKGFSEPVHQTFWNATDMYSLEYHLYTSDRIKSDPNLKYLVDLDKDGIFNETGATPPEPYIDPYPMTFEVGYSGTNPPATPVISSATVNNLYPGRYIRLIALVDEWTNYLSLKVTDPINPEPKTYIGTFAGVDYTSTPEKVFRDVDEHYNLGIVRCSPMATYPSGAKYCVYNDSEAITPPDLTPVQAEITY